MERSKFIESVSRKILNNNASLFTGAGTSIDVGYPTWYELLKPCIERLGLDITKDDNVDLLLIAQFYINENSLVDLFEIIEDNFISEDSINDNHLISKALRLPFNNIWTTNYDNVIESALKLRNIKVDKIYKDENMIINNRHNTRTLYKINGDIDDYKSIIITKEDIERMNETREIMLTFLKKDLVENSFLFLGYSFSDSIVLNTLSSLKKHMGDKYNTHYAILARESENKYFDMYVKDLFDRYRIKVLVVDDYSDIPKVIDEINERLLMKKVFISGSYDQLSEEELQLSDDISCELVNRLYEHDFRICTGVGKKLGSEIIGYAYQHLSKSNRLSVSEYLIIRPFPFHNKEEAQKHGDKHRKKLIEDNKFAIFLFGKSTGKDNSEGVYREFEIARDNGLVIIPVGATGYTAKIIWEEVKNEITHYPYLEEYIDKLETSNDGKNISDLILSIIKNYIKNNQK